MTFQKMGMVKYNAFREMSGDLSYALALLDQRNNGFVLNSVYSKEGGYSLYQGNERWRIGNSSF